MPVLSVMLLLNMPVNRGGTVSPMRLYNRALIERKVLIGSLPSVILVYDLVEVTESPLNGEVIPPLKHHTAGVTTCLPETRRDADSLYNLLQNGATFESLAPSVFRDPELASSGGDLGYFSLDEMDIAFEEQAYSMQPGQITCTRLKHHEAILLSN